MAILPSQTIDNHQYNLKCGARERITVENAVKTLTASLVNHATHGLARKVWIGVEDADIRKTQDGTDPVNTGGSEVGIAIAKDDRFSVTGNDDIDNFKAIVKTDGNTAYIEVEYYYDA
jgi:hypothetical protein